MVQNRQLHVRAQGRELDRGHGTRWLLW
jgi:hypothetical protein